MCLLQMEVVCLILVMIGVLQCVMCEAEINGHGKGSVINDKEIGSTDEIKVECRDCSQYDNGRRIWQNEANKISTEAASMTSLPWLRTTRNITQRFVLNASLSNNQSTTESLMTFTVSITSNPCDKHTVHKTVPQENLLSLMWNYSCKNNLDFIPSTQCTFTSFKVTSVSATSHIPDTDSCYSPLGSTAKFIVLQGPANITASLVPSAAHGQFACIPKYSSAKYYSLSKLHSTCRIHEQCSFVVPNSYCDEYVCKCDRFRGYCEQRCTTNQNQIGDCEPKCVVCPVVGENCSETLDCGPANSLCVDEVCQCNPEYMEVWKMCLLKYGPNYEPNKNYRTVAKIAIVSAILILIGIGIPLLWRTVKRRRSSIFHRELPSRESINSIDAYIRSRLRDRPPRYSAEAGDKPPTYDQIPGVHSFRPSLPERRHASGSEPPAYEEVGYWNVAFSSDPMCAGEIMNNDQGNYVNNDRMFTVVNFECSLASGCGTAEKDGENADGTVETETMKEHGGVGKRIDASGVSVADI